MENCNVCNSAFKKSRFSDHLKSVKHLEKLNQYYCKKCNQYLQLSEKENHLNSDEHRNNLGGKFYCEVCQKQITDKTRHFQSETHLLKCQIQHNNQHFNYSNNSGYNIK